jgi:ADP-ribose pyrophosphatase
MELYEKKLTSKQIFDGKVVKLFVDKVELPDGKEAIREIVRHPGAVCVIPVTDDGEVIMVRQYRYAHERVMLEIPAGKLDTPDEPHLEGAKRELLEETGAVAEKYTYLGSIASAPALIDEIVHVYMAENIRFGEQKLDKGEFLDIVYYTLDELFEMVMNGEITDAKTQIAILKAREILK